jgi:hypothetical protein
MDDKVLVKLIVPEVDSVYDIYLPINKKMGNIIILLNKAINDITNGSFPIANTNKLYNVRTNKQYDSNILLYNTDIRNGTYLVLVS